jgi:hypothetical protein
MFEFPLGITSDRGMEVRTMGKDKDGLQTPANSSCKRTRLNEDMAMVQYTIFLVKLG